MGIIVDVTPDPVDSAPIMIKPDPALQLKADFEAHEAAALDVYNLDLSKVADPVIQDVLIKLVRLITSKKGV